MFPNPQNLGAQTLASAWGYKFSNIRRIFKHSWSNLFFYNEVPDPGYFIRKRCVCFIILVSGKCKWGGVWHLVSDEKHSGFVTTRPGREVEPITEWLYVWTRRQNNSGELNSLLKWYSQKLTQTQGTWPILELQLWLTRGNRDPWFPTKLHLLRAPLLLHQHTGDHFSSMRASAGQTMSKRHYDPHHRSCHFVLILNASCCWTQGQGLQPGPLLWECLPFWSSLISQKTPAQMAHISMPSNCCWSWLLKYSCDFDEIV